MAVIDSCKNELLPMFWPEQKLFKDFIRDIRKAFSDLENIFSLLKEFSNYLR